MYKAKDFDMKRRKRNVARILVVVRKLILVLIRLNLVATVIEIVNILSLSVLAEAKLFDEFLSVLLVFDVSILPANLMFRAKLDFLYFTQ